MRIYIGMYEHLPLLVNYFLNSLFLLLKWLFLFSLFEYFCVLFSLSGNFNLLQKRCWRLKIHQASIQLYPQRDFRWPPILSSISMIWAVMEYVIVLGCHWGCSTRAESSISLNLSLLRWACILLCPVLNLKMMTWSSCLFYSVGLSCCFLCVLYFIYFFVKVVMVVLTFWYVIMIHATSFFH